MRKVEEWTGKTADSSIPARVRLRVYERYNGKCPKCTRKLRPDQWALDHITALANGGTHSESNLQPLCRVPCHSDKTLADVAAKSSSYRRRLSAAGIRKRKRTMGYRKFDGTVVPPRWRA